MLERQALEERFQTDVLLGDITWETSYGLPGEGRPPRVLAELGLEWPTWAQTAYRNWYLEQEYAEEPKIGIEITLRVQRLAEPVDPTVISHAIGSQTLTIGTEPIVAIGPTTETVYDPDLAVLSHGAELSFNGMYELEEKKLEDGSALDEDFATIGGWVTSALVRLGDLPLEYQPPEAE